MGAIHLGLGIVVLLERDLAGAYCLGCCWALMAVLVVVGLMNLFWMATIFVLFFVEKHWKHGIVLAKIAGGALMALGAAVIARPAVLALISQ